jgi:xylan 1,4-beta-xylosidase
MMEHNSLGRVTILSPVTWKDGWPYFGPPGNLTRSPRTWLKPNTGAKDTPHAPYDRDDDFSGKLKNIWQWNHVPVASAWSLSERPGFLRLHALAANDFWEAKNSLTQRAVGPISTVTTVLDAGGLKSGDVAGLALLNLPYAWIGVECGDGGLDIVQFDQQSGKTDRISTKATRIWLRAESDYLKDKSVFSYSLDGKSFVHLGVELVQPYQLTTFQGVRNTLFAYNKLGAPGGHADFDSFAVYEPHPRGLTRPIPYGRTVRLVSAGLETGIAAADSVKSGKPSAFQVVDMGLGRVAFRLGGRVLSVRSDGHAVLVKRAKNAKNANFQWTETPTGELVLMSLRTNRYLRVDKNDGSIVADSPGPQPNGADGTRFSWEELNGKQE